MAELAQVWQEVLPEIRQGVTGVGVWAALNGACPLIVEEGALVLGLPSQDSELLGHLRIPQTKRLIEQAVGARLRESVQLRVIEGTTLNDWEKVKRRDMEAKRLQDAANAKARAEILARTNWETIYEQLSRKYASLQNKSMPQNRAKFYKEAIEILADARKNQASQDELQDRNFARCIERVAQYSEVQSTVVARDVLEKAGEL